MPLLGNTIIFLDTGFFKKYKPKEPAYVQLFRYAKENSLVLCTSDICLEEWRSQKLKQTEDYVKTIDHHLDQLHGNNFFSKALIVELYEPEVRNSSVLDDRLRQLIDGFLSENAIKRYPPRAGHIDSTWRAYFRGDPPFKARKNRKDIPDAWIFEGAKDAVLVPAYSSFTNRFCLTGDDEMKAAFANLGFRSITITELISNLHGEEVGAVSEAGDDLHSSPLISNADSVASDTSLDAFLSKSTSASMREIYLRLVGYVIPLNTPLHEVLINAVVAKGFNRKHVEACAIMLSEGPHPYIKDTGSHYIVGNHEICSAASDVLLSEIIDMADDI